MKKGFVFLGFVLVLGLLFSVNVYSGGGQEQTAPQTVQFAMWGGATEKQVVEGYLAPFLADNPAVTVEILTPPKYWDVIQTMVAGGTPPDICYMGFPEFVDYHNQEAILSMQEYADGSAVFDEGGFHPGHLAAFSDRKTGDLYGVPKDWSTYVVYYNDDMFRSAGLQTPLELYKKGEWTVDNLIAAARKLTSGSVHGLLFEPGRWKAFVPYFAPDYIAAADKVRVNTPEFIDAVNFIKDLSLTWKVSPTVDQLSDISAGDRFSQQKGAMYIIGRWMTMRYVKSDLPFKWNVVPMPKGTDGKAHTWVDMVAYCMLDGAKSPDTAWKVIEYLTGPEGQSAVAQSGHAIPTRLSVANSDAFLTAVRPGFNNEAHIAIEEAAPVLVFDNFIKIFYGAMNTKLGLVWTGQESAEQACAELQKEIDALIKE